ncbi:SDR family NAD(P)-dependent oxidoreductase [Streptomyces sp. NPDC006645]|uniref:SDR family NAD(P)-dependent oxidoreductase n=1 Tax=unclassified Streptomyces TaxID=2593676 RepID=UPI0033B7F76A
MYDTTPAHAGARHGAHAAVGAGHRLPRPGRARRWTTWYRPTSAETQVSLRDHEVTHSGGVADVSRSVLVVGGASGSAESVAAAYARQDDWVGFLYERGTPPDELYNVRCDVSDALQLDAAVSEFETGHGVVDVLVVDADRYGRQGEESSLATAAGTRARANAIIGRTLPGMREAGHGRIVLIASTRGLGRGSALADGAPHADLMSLTWHLVHECRGSDVTVNVITYGTPQDLPRQGRAHRAQQIANLAIHLTRPEATDTGAVIPIEVLGAMPVLGPLRTDGVSYQGR